MLFRQLFDDASSTYTYLLADPASGEAVIIDPVSERLERDITLIEELGLTLRYAIDTHVHADHVTAAGRLRERLGCITAISAQAGVDCANLLLREGDIIRFGTHSLRVLETPGHTNTCLSLVMPDRVFTGDALLIRGCGRSDFQSGDAERLYHSITGKLFSLPDETRVYPSHDYHGMTLSTIGEEKRHNPRLRLGHAGFIHFMETLELPYPQRMQEAVPANERCGRNPGE